MHKTTKALLVIAACLLIVGVILGSAGYALGGMRSVRMWPNGPTVSSSATIDVSSADIKAAAGSRGVTALDIDASFANIHFKEGTDFAISGNYDDTMGDFAWSVDNGTLLVRLKADQGVGFSSPFGGFGFNTLGVDLTITYPKGASLDTLRVVGDLGNAECPALTAKTVEFDLNAGSLTINGLTCEDLTIDMDLGSATLTNCSVSHAASIDLSAGSLTASGCRINNLSNTCDMGSVVYSGTLTGEASFSVAMGSLTMNLDQAASDIVFDLSCDMGSAQVNGKRVGELSGNATTGTPELKLTAISNMGSIAISTSR